MGRSVHNLHLDALAFVRHRVGCDYGTALRLVQLYGFLEHLCSQGGGCSFNQSAYCDKTGCHRATLRSDLATLRQHGWAEVDSTNRGTRVRLLPMPFEAPPEVQFAADREQQAPTSTPARCSGQCLQAAQGVDTGCPASWTPGVHQLDTGCPSAGHRVSNNKKLSKNFQEGGEEGGTPPQAVAAQPSAGPAGPPPDPEEEETGSNWKPKPRAWTTEKRERVRQLWNQHRPANFAPLSEGGLDYDRAMVVARIMYGRGGYTAFVDLLPRVLEYLKRDTFWGNQTKRFTWDNFFGNVGNRKAHWAQAVDEVLSADSPDQGLHHDRIPVRFEPFGEQWLPLAPNLSTEDFIRAAIDLVRSGKAPREALQYLEPWTPDHPYNATLDD